MSVIIAVVAFDRISPFNLSVPCMVFGEPRPDLGLPIFELRVCAAEPGQLLASSGFGFAPSHPLAAIDGADIVIVPSWRDIAEAPPPALLDALLRTHRRGARIVGLCLGAFVLAAAGLLDGRRATTHWNWASALAARYPAIEVDSDVLYVDDGDIVTSAGVAAGLDCCLHLVRQLCGAQLANRLARRLVIAPHRQGGQAQFIEQPLPESPADDRIAAVLAWAVCHLDQPHSIASLAARAAMSRRTFTRHVRKATGTSVVRWLLHQRVSHAQRLLETTAQPIEHVASAAGFGSALSLRQHFRANLATSPSAYRALYRGGKVQAD